MKVNSWDEFQPLEQVVVGSFYDSSFFEDIKNPRIRDVLVKIADETNEDIEYFKQQIKSHNIDVLQATPRELGYHDNILEYVDIEGRMGLTKHNGASGIVKPNLIPAPPLEPRDHMVVLGNKILITDPVDNVRGYCKKFKQWFGEQYVDDSLFEGKVKFTRNKDGGTMQNVIKLFDLPDNLNDLSEKQQKEIYNKHKAIGFCSPNITRIGKKCFVDVLQTKDSVPFLKSNYPEFNYEQIELGGHNDGIFTVVKPGLVFASNFLVEQNYQHIFDKWQIEFFDDPNWDKVVNFGKMKHQNLGKWWVPEQEENDDFINFVEYFLHNLTGQVDETLFDLNILVLDDRYVVVNSHSDYLFEVLKKHNLEPIVCPLRHRFFFDGGWHCLTLDVKRKGGQIDYGL